MTSSLRFPATTALSLLLAMSASAQQIIAHRGASHDAPENSLTAMKLAWEQKADAIEMDLWLCRDGKIVIFHDKDTSRYDGQKRIVSTLSAAEMAALDVGSWKDPAFRGEKVPALDDILATVPAGGRAVLELKCGPEIVPELVRVLAATGTPHDRLCIISFQLEAVRASRKALPDIPHYLLAGYRKDARPGEEPRVEPLIEAAKEAGLDGLNLQADWPITAAFTAKVNAAGLRLLAWTVDDPAVARRLAEAGVEAITTNRPGWLREQLTSKPVPAPPACP